MMRGCHLYSAVVTEAVGFDTSSDGARILKPASSIKQPADFEDVFLGGEEGWVP